MKFAYLIEPPFNDRAQDGRVTGCDVELARTVLRQIGVIDIELVETEFAQLLPGLADGRWQMTTGMFATAERRAVATFSRSIWALPDGLLVRAGNPKDIQGYLSIARRDDCVLAIVRDQFQHQSAIGFGVPQERILLFETYANAAAAIQDGRADAYASVARAHAGYFGRTSGLPLALVTVPANEKQPTFGSFAFGKNDGRLRSAVDAALTDYLGSVDHRAMMRGFGFNDAEIDMVATIR